MTHVTSRSNFLKLEEFVLGKHMGIDIDTVAQQNLKLIEDLHKQYMTSLFTQSTKVDAAQIINFKILSLIYTDQNLMNEVIKKIGGCFDYAKQKCKKQNDAVSDFDFDTFNAKEYDAYMENVILKINMHPSFCDL